MTVIYFIIPLSQFCICSARVVLLCVAGCASIDSDVNHHKISSFFCFGCCRYIMLDKKNKEAYWLLTIDLYAFWSRKTNKIMLFFFITNPYKTSKWNKKKQVVVHRVHFLLRKIHYFTHLHCYNNQSYINLDLTNNIILLSICLRALLDKSLILSQTQNHRKISIGQLFGGNIWTYKTDLLLRQACVRNF